MSNFQFNELNESLLGTRAGWKKYGANPVLGGNLGVCFDIAVLKDGSKYRMYFSWRSQKSIAVTESSDGVNWDEPVICLGPNVESGWEEEVNRPVVLKKADGYHMWYTGQKLPGQPSGKSWIGYALSADGITWKRVTDKPVMSAEEEWEKVAVMCPHVIWDEDLKLYKMWYSGGEQYEPNAIGYATSKDGIKWRKYEMNPIFGADKSTPWEQHKVTACQVIQDDSWYIMFYIGFYNEDRAQIGVARSKDGITNWERHKANPIICPDEDKWDAEACYKPFAIYDEEKWLLWYNGRNGAVEQIGAAFHEGKELGFNPQGES